MVSFTSTTWEESQKSDGSPGDAEPEPVLVASTLSSMDVEEYETEDSRGVVDERGDQERVASVFTAGPLSWFCMPSMESVLPSCAADRTSSGLNLKEPESGHTSTSGNTRRRALTRPEQRQEEDFKEAFDTGRLLPFLVESCVNGNRKDVCSPSHTLPLHRRHHRHRPHHPALIALERTWEGHLPLAPMPLVSLPSLCSDDSLDSIDSPCCMRTDSQEPRDPSYSEEAAAPPPPPAAKDAASRGIRRPPTAANSMSIPSSQAAKMGKNDPKKHKAEVEKVQVQQAGADRASLKELPALRDAPPAKREELFILKLKLCSVIFSFDDPTADKRGKDMKRQTLLELVDYVNTPAGQKIFTESVMGDLMAMVSANVCRALPPATDDFDPEEDEPVLEPAWPHLQVAYEFFLRFIVSSEVNAKAAKKYVDQKFCLQLVELFDSEDPRERDYLKTILHRIYGKFMSHRSFIRRAISNVFYRFVYETERHNGIGELLEILGSIINGFAIPLKKEHLQFLVRALIPLHKPKCVALYHQQLSYCIIQYVEKDADTATPILNGFFKCWPWSCSGKQVMFLNELEEILELLGADQLAQVSTMLFTNLARCLDSDHFQVVERALFLWNNEHLVNSGCLSRLNAQAVLPIIYGPLYKNSSGHWNATVEGLAQNVLKMYMEYDLVLYDKCTAAYFREEEEAKRKLQAIEDRWSAIEKMASTNQPAITVK